jgi:hypothetical protein
MPGSWSEPMKVTLKPWWMMAAACAAWLLAACDPGPLEKAGKAVDRAGEKAGEKIKDIAK